MPGCRRASLAKSSNATGGVTQAAALTLDRRQMSPPGRDQEAMWLLTTIGFYSVVQHRDDPDMLIVRARTREDIEALCDRRLPVGDIVAEAGTDYRYRVFCARAEFEEAVAGLVHDLDYPNFKNAVAERQGAERAGLYSKIWSLLHRLQADE